MIVSLLLYLLYYTVLLFLSPLLALPDASLPSGLTSAISTAGGYITAIDPYFPLSTVLTVFGLVLSVEAGIFTYKFIMWIIHKIPTMGGGSPS